MTGWRTIDTAPRDGTRVLIYGSYRWSDDPYKEPETGIVTASWASMADDDQDEGEWMLVSTNPYCDYATPTHWMELPPPPGIAIVPGTA